MSSEPFIVDSSPPVPGSVWNGSPNSNVSPPSLLTLISLSLPPPSLRQQRVKDPGHSAKSAGGRLQLNTQAHKHVAMTSTENWCMIVWCTQNVRRGGTSWHQPQRCKDSLRHFRGYLTPSLPQQVKFSG